MKLKYLNDVYIKELDDRITGIALMSSGSYVSIIPLDIEIKEEYGTTYANIVSRELPITFSQEQHAKNDKNFIILYKQLDGSLSNDIEECKLNSSADIRILHIPTGAYRDLCVGTRDWREVHSKNERNRTLFDIFYYIFEE